MSFSSIMFLVFVVITCVVYYILPKKFRWMSLLAASIVFYVSYDVRAIIYLLTTIITTYIGARIIHYLHSKTGEKEVKTRNKNKAKVVLILTLLFNFAFLFVFKYSNFFIENVNFLIDKMNLDMSIGVFKLLMPIGISFYIFQSLGYVIDIYFEKYIPEKNIAKFGLFVSFFPQIVQGPINKFNLISKQLVDGNDFSFDNIRNGIELIMWGLLKKALIADLIFVPIQDVYTNFVQYDGLMIFLAVVAYNIQLYCDFSGGIDIARGVSELFGIKMMKNFDSPYFSTSIEKFWQKWHISLGEWMKDYVFYPFALSKVSGKITKFSKKMFGNNVGKKIPACIATIVTFLCVGIWQGPGWQNIVYGLYNGLIMSFTMLMGDNFKNVLEKLHINPKAIWYKVFQIVRTFLLVCIGRYFSHSESLTSAINMLKSTITNPTGIHSFVEQFKSLAFTSETIIILVFMMIILFVVDYMTEKSIDVRKWLHKRKPIVQASVMFVGIVLIVFLIYFNSEYTAIEYIYANV